MNQVVMNTQSLEGAMMNDPEQQQEKRLKPLPEQSLKCPRCDSTNTKFCYYNNYSLSQPRYFCKGCRRYWTQGGSLRNVPVGGGCRRNKRLSSSSSSPASSSSSPASSSINSSKRLLQDDAHLLTTSCPQMVLLPSLPTPSMLTHYSFQTNHDPSLLANPNSHGFLDILRSGFLENSSSGGLQSFYHGFGLDDKQLIIPNTEVSSYCKKSVDVDRQISGLDGNLGLDSGRDFWGGVGFGSIGGSSSSSSIWQGLVNSSLM